MKKGEILNTKVIRLSASPPGFGDTPDELESEMFVSAVPVQHSHSDYENDDIGLYVGLWDTTSMTEVAGPYACDEFMWLLEGEVEIRNNATGSIDKVCAGEAFVIPQGYDCQWLQTGYLRKYYVIFEPPELAVPLAPAVNGIVKPKLIERRNRSVEQTDTVAYEDSEGLFCAGSWQSGPFRCGLCDKPYHQFVFVAEGSLHTVDAGGEEQAFEKGEALFIPKGTWCSWRAEGDLGIHYVKVHT